MQRDVNGVKCELCIDVKFNETSLRSKWTRRLRR
jgi:hypothetical protein